MGESALGDQDPSDPGVRARVKLCGQLAAAATATATGGNPQNASASAGIAVDNNLFGYDSWKEFREDVEEIWDASGETPVDQSTGQREVEDTPFARRVQYAKNKFNQTPFGRAVTSALEEAGDFLTPTPLNGARASGGDASSWRQELESEGFAERQYEYGIARGAVEAPGAGMEACLDGGEHVLRGMGVSPGTASDIRLGADLLLGAAAVSTGGAGVVRGLRAVGGQARKAVGRGVQKVAVRTGGASAAEGAGAGSSLDHVIKGPYNSRTMEQTLAANNPGADVTAHTMARRGDPNAKLAGGQHTETGVPFDHRGFPIFEQHVVFETRLDPSFVSKNPQAQMREATRQIRDLIQKGEMSKSIFSARQLQDINAGSAKITDFTWHHHQETGRMQLLSAQIHETVRHSGGASKW